MIKTVGYYQRICWMVPRIRRGCIRRGCTRRPFLEFSRDFYENRVIFSPNNRVVPIANRREVREKKKTVSKEEKIEFLRSLYEDSPNFADEEAALLKNIEVASDPVIFKKQVQVLADMANWRSVWQILRSEKQSLRRKAKGSVAWRSLRMKDRFERHKVLEPIIESKTAEYLWDFRELVVKSLRKKTIAGCTFSSEALAVFFGEDYVTGINAYKNFSEGIKLSGAEFEKKNRLVPLQVPRTTCDSLGFKIRGAGGDYVLIPLDMRSFLSEYMWRFASTKDISTLYGPQKLENLLNSEVAMLCGAACETKNRALVSKIIKFVTEKFEDPQYFSEKIIQRLKQLIEAQPFLAIDAFSIIRTIIHRHQSPSTNEKSFLKWNSQRIASLWDSHEKKCAKLSEILAMGEKLTTAQYDERNSSIFVGVPVNIDGSIVPNLIQIDRKKDHAFVTTKTPTPTTLISPESRFILTSFGAVSGKVYNHIPLKYLTTKEILLLVEYMLENTMKNCDAINVFHKIKDILSLINARISDNETIVSSIKKLVTQHIEEEPENGGLALSAIGHDDKISTMWNDIVDSRMFRAPNSSLMLSNSGEKDSATNIEFSMKNRTAYLQTMPYTVLGKLYDSAEVNDLTEGELLILFKWQLTKVYERFYGAKKVAKYASNASGKQTLSRMTEMIMNMTKKEPMAKPLCLYLAKLLTREEELDSFNEFEGSKYLIVPDLIMSPLLRRLIGPNDGCKECFYIVQNGQLQAVLSPELRVKLVLSNYTLHLRTVPFERMTSLEKKAYLKGLLCSDDTSFEELDRFFNEAKQTDSVSEFIEELENSENQSQVLFHNEIIMQYAPHVPLKPVPPLVSLYHPHGPTSVGTYGSSTPLEVSTKSSSFLKTVTGSYLVPFAKRLELRDLTYSTTSVFSQTPLTQLSVDEIFQRFKRSFRLNSDVSDEVKIVKYMVNVDANDSLFQRLSGIVVKELQLFPNLWLKAFEIAFFISIRRYGSMNLESGIQETAIMVAIAHCLEFKSISSVFCEVLEARMKPLLSPVQYAQALGTLIIACESYRQSCEENPGQSYVFGYARKKKTGSAVDKIWQIKKEYAVSKSEVQKMIEHYYAKGNRQELISLYNEFPQSLNSKAFEKLLLFFGRDQSWTELQELFEGLFQMKGLPTGAHYEVVMHSLANNGYYKELDELWRSYESRIGTGSPSVYLAMLVGSYRKHYFRAMYDIFHKYKEMYPPRKAGNSVAEVQQIYGYGIRACSRLRLMDEAESLLQRVKHEEVFTVEGEIVPVNSDMYVALLTGPSKIGDMIKSEKIFKAAINEFGEPDDIILSAYMRVFLNSNSSAKGLEIFKKYQRFASVMALDVYLELLFAAKKFISFKKEASRRLEKGIVSSEFFRLQIRYFMNGLKTKEAWSTFEEMKKFNIKPGSNHYREMAYGYASFKHMNGLPKLIYHAKREKAAVSKKTFNVFFCKQLNLDEARESSSPLMLFNTVRKIAKSEGVEVAYKFFDEFCGRLVGNQSMFMRINILRTALLLAGKTKEWDKVEKMFSSLLSILETHMMVNGKIQQKLARFLNPIMIAKFDQLAHQWRRSEIPSFIESLLFKGFRLDHGVFNRAVITLVEDRSTLEEGLELAETYLARSRQRVIELCRRKNKMRGPIFIYRHRPGPYANEHCLLKVSEAVGDKMMIYGDRYPMMMDYVREYRMQKSPAGDILGDQGMKL